MIHPKKNWKSTKIRFPLPRDLSTCIHLNLDLFDWVPFAALRRPILCKVWISFLKYFHLKKWAPKAGLIEWSFSNFDGRWCNIQGDGQCEIGAIWRNGPECFNLQEKMVPHSWRNVSTKEKGWYGTSSTRDWTKSGQPTMGHENVQKES